MLKEQAGNAVVLLHAQTAGQRLEHPDYEIAGNVYQNFHTTSLGKFTSAWIDGTLDSVHEILHRLEQSPEVTFLELMEVIQGLRETRDELRLARFLFDREEIPPLYGLVMRNRAVLRGETILQKVLKVWPVHA